MNEALHSLSFYEEIVAHTNLKLMTKLTNNVAIRSDNWPTANEQSKAFLGALIANTEGKLIERKTKLISQGGLN